MPQNMNNSDDCLWNYSTLKLKLHFMSLINIQYNNSGQSNITHGETSLHLSIYFSIDRLKIPLRNMDNTIFDQFHRFARILSLYNRERYQLTDRKAWWRQILFALIFSILIIFAVLLLVTAIWHCFDCDFSIMGTAFALPVSFVILQLFSVCISMVKDNREIAIIVNKLQKIIEKREDFAVCL